MSLFQSYNKYFFSFIVANINEPSIPPKIKLLDLIIQVASLYVE